MNHSIINNLKRVNSVQEGRTYEEDVLLLPEEIGLTIDDNCNVQTHGLSEALDKRHKDLMRIIEIKDPFRMEYEETNVLSPLVYIHEQKEDMPWHITTQGFLLTKLHEDTLAWIKEENAKHAYGKHDVDEFYLPFSKDIESVKANDLVCVFNRRVKGWDGSVDRPVIELLGAGGHLPSVWDEEAGRFKTLSIKENLLKEFQEEIGVTVSEENITVIGGFQNDSSHELVILCGVYVEDSKLKVMQDYAIGNVEEDTDGIYIGTFEETIAYYKKRPEPFAGGAKAAPYNFPNRDELMDLVRQIYMGE